MNTWQVCRQLQYLIRARKWTGSASSVFHTDSVKITPAPRESVVETAIMPACLIRPLGATSDPEAAEEPDLLDQEIAFTLAISHTGDSWGEYPLMGGQRTGQTDSDGRGLLEVEEELLAAIELLNTDDGVVIEHRMTSDHVLVDAVRRQGVDRYVRPVASRVFDFVHQLDRLILSHLMGKA